MTKGRQWLLALILVAGTARAVSAQDQDVGQANFKMSCASCHGAEGKGNGPVSGQLKVPPPDLTVLTKKNNGVFPVSHVYEIIDGRQAVIAHGTRDMPIWGDVFKSLNRDPAAATMRVSNLTDYVRSLQVK